MRSNLKTGVRPARGIPKKAGHWRRLWRMIPMRSSLKIDTSNNPFVIKGRTNSDARILNGKARISLIYWLNPAKAGDLLTLSNNGRQLLTLRCEADHESQRFSFGDAGILTKYLSCPKLDSGEVFIYTAQAMPKA